MTGNAEQISHMAASLHKAIMAKTSRSGLHSASHALRMVVLTHLDHAEQPNQANKRQFAAGVGNKPGPQPL